MPQRSNSFASNPNRRERSFARLRTDDIVRVLPALGRCGLVFSPSYALCSLDFLDRHHSRLRANYEPVPDFRGRHKRISQHLFGGSSHSFLPIQYLVSRFASSVVLTTVEAMDMKCSVRPYGQCAAYIALQTAISSEPTRNARHSRECSSVCAISVQRVAS